jgi:hypothetical protein
MLRVSTSPSSSGMSVCFATTTSSGAIEVACGADDDGIFIEFRLPEMGRKFRAGTKDGVIPERESGDEGQIRLSIDGEPEQYLLIRGGEIFDEAGVNRFSDGRLADLYNPLCALKDNMPSGLQSRVRSAVAADFSAPVAFSEVEGYWDCVGTYTAAGAELGGMVGFAAGATVGILAGGAPALLSGPAGALAGGIGGATGGFLGGLAVC